MKRISDIIMAAAARALALAAAVAVMSGMVSCDKVFEPVGAVYSCDEYTVYPDSFASAGVTLRAMDEGMMVRDASGVRIEPIGKGGRRGIGMEGSDSLMVYLFNMETHRGDSGYDCFTPYEVYVAEGLLEPDSAAMIADGRIKRDGTLMGFERDGYRWPVVMSDASWVLAAETVTWMTDGDADAEKRAAALKRLVDRDIAYVYDRGERLFAGVPVEMSESQIPGWMNAGDAAAVMTLEGNVSRLAAMRYVDKVLPGSYGEDVTSLLGRNISKRFWIPNLSMLSQTLYQKPYPIAVTATDNMVQALAVVTGGVGDEMSHRVVSRTPVTATGIPVTYPDQGITGEGHRQALTTAMWMIAAARVGNSDAWGVSYSSLVSQSVTDGYALRMLQGAVLRSVFGLDPDADGLWIRPFVHDMLGDYRRITGVRYRGGVLDITVRGKGNMISTFAIDGEVVQKPVVPRDIEGRHEVEVVLAGSDDTADGVNFASVPLMPPPPEVENAGKMNFRISSDDTGHYIVYLNGAISEIIARDDYELYAAAPLTSVCFEADVSNQVTGYASRGYLYIPERDSISIACTAVAHKGGRVLAKKDLAAKHVESTRYKNARIEFAYESAMGGDYYIRLRYLDGLGIVNTSRQYALRLLRVNGDNAGIMVLPQRGPEMWRPDEDWASMCGTTLPIAVGMRAGHNDIAVEYFAPEGDDGFDHDSNTVIPVALEIIRKI